MTLWWCVVPMSGKKNPESVGASDMGAEVSGPTEAQETTYWLHF